MGATVNSATMSLYVNGVKTSATVGAYELIESWDENEATWLDRELSTAWSTPGGTFNPTEIDSTPVLGGGRAYWNISTAVTAWVNGDTNNGILLNTINSGTNEVKFESSDGSSPKLPELEICYAVDGTLTPTSTPEPTSTPAPTNTPAPTATPSPLVCGMFDASADSYMIEDNPNYNKGTDSELRIKTEAGKEKRSIVYFDVSSIPAGSTVQSADFSLWVKDVSNGPVNTSIYGLIENWVESEVNWNDRDQNSNIAWTAAGGTYAVPAIDSRSLSQKDVRETWDITPLAADWVSGSDNNGILLSAPTGVKREVKFSSRDEGDNDKHPQLEICYLSPGSAMTQPDSAPGMVVTVAPAVFGVFGIAAVPWLRKRRQN